MSSSSLRDVDAPVPRIEPASTERLTIRPIDLGDVDALWERRNDASTARYQSWEVPYPREAAERLVTGVVTCGGVPPVDGWFQLAVDERDTGRPLGDLALHLTERGRSAEIGYTFHPSARGRGLAGEAAAWLVEWCFESLGASRVSAQMHPEHRASARVAERVGMVVEGRLRNAFWLDRADGTSEHSDDLVYAMVPESWRAWRDRPGPPEHVRLIELTPDNVRAALDLATHHTQEDLVAPMSVSIADAYRPAPHLGEPIVAWPRLIEADGETVGFVMLAEPNAAAPEAYLWRLLIDRMHQRRGIGRRAVELVIDEVRSWGCPALDVSWMGGPGSPEPFYLALGFRPTGKIEDGEIAARLPL